jgi:predicted PurR-regulated permease PerM
MNTDRINTRAIPKWVFWFLITLALAVYFMHNGYDTITALGVGFILAYIASITLGYTYSKLKK